MTKDPLRRTLSDKTVMFNRDIKPRLGSKTLSALTENECWDAIYDKSKASKDRANKMAGIELGQHPAPTLNSNWFAIGPRANRRFLDNQELEWLLEAVSHEARFYRRAILLLLLTAARRNELFGASAAEIVDGIWRLPPECSKNGEANIVALGAWGRLLAETNDAWLFPSSRMNGPQRDGWHKIHDRIHVRMEKPAGAHVVRWHFHDLRRTFRSHARSVGIDRDVAELMLNHKREGLEGIYNRAQELELRAAGFKAWEDFLVERARATACAGLLEVPFGPSNITQLG